MVVLRAAEPNVEVTVAVTRRVRRYGDLSTRNYDTAERLTEMMNGTHRSSQYNKEWSLNPSERIVAVQYAEGSWFVFTEELVMGPGNVP